MSATTGRTAGRLPKRHSHGPLGWRRTPAATSISPTNATTACGRSTRRGRSRLWRAPAKGATGGTAGRPYQAQLSSPFGVAADSRGNVFIADQGNHRVRRVDPAGTITTVAGTGEGGYGGDGGPAYQAQLSSPFGVAADSRGNVFIADEGNHRVRRVDSAGTITTVAGTGEAGYGGDGGPAYQAQLSSPRGVAADSRGNVYIADAGNHRVRRVDPTGTITNFAGSDVLPPSSTAPGNGGVPSPPTPQDPGEELATATPVDLGTEISARIDSGSDVDFFRLVIIERILVTVYTTGELDTIGSLRDELNREIGSGDNSGADLNFRIEATLGPGVYFVQVMASGSGTYTLHVDSRRPLVDESGDDHGDDLSSATLIDLEKPVWGRIDAGDDADFFRLEIRESTELAVYTTGGLDTIGKLHDESNSVVGVDDDSGTDLNFRIETTLVPGTYFIQLKSASGTTGRYALHTDRWVHGGMQTPSESRSALEQVLLPQASSCSGIDWADDEMDKSALLGAAIVCNNESEARRLLIAGASPNAGGSDSSLNLTPLHMAILLRRTTILRLLLDRGADPNADFFGFHVFTLVSDQETAGILLNAGTDPKSDPHGCNPLHSEAARNSSPLTRKLLTAGADPSSACFGKFPLHLGGQRGGSQLAGGSVEEGTVPPRALVLIRLTNCSSF